MSRVGTMDAVKWDERYSSGRVWSLEPNTFFAEALSNIDPVSFGVVPGRAVDLACGEGRNAVWLAAKGWDVTGVDFSAAGIQTGRSGAAAEGVGVEWVVADLIDWELGEGCWELVAHVYLHWPTAIREPFLRRCAAGLAPGGYFVIVGHDRDNIEHGHGGPQDPDVLTTPGELSELLESCGLEVVEAKIVHRPVTLEGGHGQAGPEAADAIDHVVVARRT